MVNKVSPSKIVPFMR